MECSHNCTIGDLLRVGFPGPWPLARLDRVGSQNSGGWGNSQEEKAAREMNRGRPSVSRRRALLVLKGGYLG